MESLSASQNICSFRFAHKLGLNRIILLAHDFLPTPRAGFTTAVSKGQLPNSWSVRVPLLLPPCAQTSTFDDAFSPQNHQDLPGLAAIAGHLLTGKIGCQETRRKAPW